MALDWDALDRLHRGEVEPEPGRMPELQPVPTSARGRRKLFSQEYRRRCEVHEQQYGREPTADERRATKDKIRADRPELG
jgi:hypothetical protein